MLDDFKPEMTSEDYYELADISKASLEYIAYQRDELRKDVARRDAIIALLVEQLGGRATISAHVLEKWHPNDVEVVQARNDADNTLIIAVRKKQPA